MRRFAQALSAKVCRQLSLHVWQGVPCVCSTRLQCRFKASQEVLHLVEAFCIQAGATYGSMSAGMYSNHCIWNFTACVVVFDAIYSADEAALLKIMSHCSAAQKYHLLASAGASIDQQSKAAQVCCVPFTACNDATATMQSGKSLSFSL